MKTNTYLNFAGTCKEALQYYEKHLGAKIQMMMTFDQMPDPKQFPPGMEKGSSPRPHHDWRHGGDGERRTEG